MFDCFFIRWTENDLHLSCEFEEIRDWSDDNRRWWKNSISRRRLDNRTYLIVLVFGPLDSLASHERFEKEYTCKDISPSAEENCSAIDGRIIGKYDMRDYCWHDERWRKRSQSMLRTNNICQARRRRGRGESQLTERKLTSIVKKIIRRSVQFDLMPIIRWSEGNCITSNARSPLNRPTVISLSLSTIYMYSSVCAYRWFLSF